MDKSFWAAAGFIIAQLALVYVLVQGMTEDLEFELNQLENRVDELYRVVWTMEK